MIKPRLILTCSTKTFCYRTLVVRNNEAKVLLVPSGNLGKIVTRNDGKLSVRVGYFPRKTPEGQICVDSIYAFMPVELAPGEVMCVALNIPVVDEDFSREWHFEYVLSEHIVKKYNFPSVFISGIIH